MLKKMVGFQNHNTTIRDDDVESQDDKNMKELSKPLSRKRPVRLLPLHILLGERKNDIRMIKSPDFMVLQQIALI